jgi:DNA-binding NarL/FixJ family response regulator
MNQKIIFTVDQDRVITATTLGLSRKMMADHLDMNFETFCGHLKIIFAKLGFHCIAELVSYALKNGYDKL